MVNLLRSDFYRLFRSLSFYICTLVAVALVSGSAFLADWASRMLAENGNSTGIPGIQDGISYGIAEGFAGGNVHLFMAIFLGIFITAEFSHGTMKNAVSKGFPKFKIYLSKFITMTAATYIMMLLVFVFSTITAWMITGKFGEFTWDFTGQIFRLAGIELLLHAALTALFVMIAMVVRNTAGVIAINIVGVVSFGPVIYQLLEMIFKNKIKFSDYSLRNNISLYYHNLTPQGEDILRSIIVGMAFLAITTAIGLFAFKKSDIK